MDIKDIIPQRDPFLFIDEIIENNENTIKAQFHFKEDLPFFKGHFPNNPIVPGVILNEACFQSAAALIALTADKTASVPSLAVVSRVQNAKFKMMVKPNDTIIIDTNITQRMGNAAYFKSVVKNQNQNQKKVLIIEFACTLVEES